MQEIARDLFELLQEKVGCEYISDLPFAAKQNPLAVIHAVASIRPSDFTLHQWNDALEYIVKAPAQHTDIEAYSLLLYSLSAVNEDRGR